MKIIIAAGGTAGHINPGLAIAQHIQSKHPDAQIMFVGRKEGMEYGLVTKAGYDFCHMEVTGFQRRLTLNNIKRNFITVKNLLFASSKAKKILKDFAPDLVIGTGGYVSGPIVLQAAKMGIKTAIHEQNAFAGVTNKLLSKNVDTVLCYAYNSGPFALKQISKLKKPSIGIMFGESDVGYSIFTYYITTDDTDLKNRHFRNRHGNSANVLYADAHVGHVDTWKIHYTHDADKPKLNPFGY